jgi:hypothetical protein
LGAAFSHACESLDHHRDFDGACRTDTFIAIEGVFLTCFEVSREESNFSFKRRNLSSDALIER